MKTQAFEMYAGPSLGVEIWKLLQHYWKISCSRRAEVQAFGQPREQQLKTQVETGGSGGQSVAPSPGASCTEVCFLLGRKVNVHIVP